MLIRAWLINCMNGSQSDARHAVVASARLARKDDDVTGAEPKRQRQDVFCAAAHEKRSITPQAHGHNGLVHVWFHIIQVATQRITVAIVVDDGSIRAKWTNRRTIVPINRPPHAGHRRRDLGCNLAKLGRKRPVRA
eukprot:353422-Chlamydomonas_euryale.AAC.2